MSEPSKINATINSTVGGIRETVGAVTGLTGQEIAGKQQKASGDAEYKAAQAQGYAEGTADRVGGKVSALFLDCRHYLTQYRFSGRSSSRCGCRRFYKRDVGQGAERQGLRSARSQQIRLISSFALAV